MSGYADNLVLKGEMYKENADISEQHHLYLNEVYDFGPINRMVLWGSTKGLGFIMNSRSFSVL